MNEEAIDWMWCVWGWIYEDGSKIFGLGEWISFLPSDHKAMGDLQ